MGMWAPPVGTLLHCGKKAEPHLSLQLSVTLQCPQGTGRGGGVAQPAANRLISFCQKLLLT